MTRYTTRHEAIHREIIEPLAESAPDFNTDAIANAVLLGYTDGYALNPDVDFWAVVAKHEIPDNHN